MIPTSSKWSHEGTYTIRAGSLGRDGYRACLLLPTRHGEIVFSATIPAGAIAQFRPRLCDLVRSCAVSGSDSGPTDVVDLAQDCDVQGVGDLISSLAQGASALGPLGGLAGGAIQALGGLFGGGPPPPRFDPHRPRSLPAGGSPENLRRILDFVHVADGEDASSARRKLVEGASNHWNVTDYDDAMHLVGALPQSGPISTAVLVAHATPGAPPSVSVAPPLPGTAAMLAHLASSGAGVPGVSPAQLHALTARGLAGPAAVSQALHALSDAPSLFGPASVDFSRLLAGVMRAGDARVGSQLGLHGLHQGLPAGYDRAAHALLSAP